MDIIIEFCVCASWRTFGRMRKVA